MLIYSINMAVLKCQYSAQTQHIQDVFAVFLMFFPVQEKTTTKGWKLLNSAVKVNANSF